MLMVLIWPNVNDSVEPTLDQRKNAVWEIHSLICSELAFSKCERFHLVLPIEFYICFDLILKEGDTSLTPTEDLRRSTLPSGDVGHSAMCLRVDTCTCLLSLIF